MSSRNRLHIIDFHELLKQNVCCLRFCFIFSLMYLQVNQIMAPCMNDVVCKLVTIKAVYCLLRMVSVDIAIVCVIALSSFGVFLVDEF